MYNIFVILQTRYWVDQILGAKIQALAVDELNVAVLSNRLGEAPILSSANFNVEKTYTSADLWIFEGLKIAIQSIGENYSELVKERSKNNLLFLIFTLLVLLIGVGIIIRNIQNAMKVAQLKSDFVSNVSHEIRTPLALIKMYAETLMLGRLSSDSRRKEYYEVIYHESGRLTHLVNNILDFSRIEANKMTYDFLALELDKQIEAIFHSYEYTFKEKTVRCHLKLNAAGVMINGDHQALNEAIANLIENAIKYKRDDKEGIEITVTTEMKNKEVLCHITDNGVGISKIEYDKIFDRFYRIESALTQQTKGTGMGLSLVKHIMLAHNGSVTVQSKLNTGSTFSLVFPIIDNK
jgi:two-component system phosphate regulon sensor histidine kinase PhoR